MRILIQVVREPPDGGYWHPFPENEIYISAKILSDSAFIVEVE